MLEPLMLEPLMLEPLMLEKPDLVERIEGCVFHAVDARERPSA